jgi:ribosomal protein L9
MFDFDEGDLKDEKKFAIIRKSFENDKKIQKKLMKIKNKYYNDNKNSNSITNKDIYNAFNNENNFNSDNKNINFQTPYDTNDHVNIKDIKNYENTTKTVKWKCGSCSKLGIVYMEIYGADFLTPSFEICISKHHHHH